MDNRGLDLFLGQAGVTQHQALQARGARLPVGWTRRAVQAVGAQRRRDQAAVAGQRGDLLIASQPSGAIGQTRHQMHARFVGLNVQQPHKVLAGVTDQSLLPRRVERPHPPDVRREVALADEVRQDRLHGDGRVIVDDGAGGGKGLHQSRRNHQIGDAQGGKEHLREGTEIDHPIGIQALQRRQRPPRIAELAVVVILQDPGVGFARPVEQLQSARQRHHHPQRILMRGRHHRQTGLGRPLPSLFDRQALAVHRQGNLADAGGDNRSGQTVIARRLQPDLVAGIGQNAQGQIEGLL